MGAQGAEQIPLSRPEIGERESELVLGVLRSGQLSLGPMLERFERAFARWLGVGEAVAVSSGTSALHLAVRAMGWGRGDEVLTSPFSFVASANCLLYEGARPVFCDIDPVTLNLDPKTAEAAVTEKSAGALPVHIFGYPAAMVELETLCARRGLGMVEDACEALGARDAEGRGVGTRGHLAAFAFYPNKQMTTGEGGMLATPDREAAAVLRSVRNQGRALDMGEVEHERLGFNYRLSDLACALGVAQLERLDELLARRAAVAAAYTERLSAQGAPAGEGDPDGLVLPCADRGQERRSWFVYVVQLPSGTQREEVMAALAAQGIASKAYLPAIHLFPHLRALGYSEGQFPVAERVASRSLALPFFPSLAEGQIARVCEALVATLR